MASEEENQDERQARQERGEADQARGRIENALQSYRHALGAFRVEPERRGQAGGAQATRTSTPINP